MIEQWVRKYGPVVGFTTAIVVVTMFLVRLESTASETNRNLLDIKKQMQDVNRTLEVYVQDRERYERWNRQINARLKRVFNRMGWEYEGVE